LGLELLVIGVREGGGFGFAELGRGVGGVSGVFGGAGVLLVLGRDFTGLLWELEGVGFLRGGRRRLEARCRVPVKVAEVVDRPAKRVGGGRARDVPPDGLTHLREVAFDAHCLATTPGMREAIIWL